MKILKGFVVLFSALTMIPVIVLGESAPTMLRRGASVTLIVGLAIGFRDIVVRRATRRAEINRLIKDRSK
jgi:hypothetical protein